MRLIDHLIAPRLEEIALPAVAPHRTALAFRSRTGENHAERRRPKSEELKRKHVERA
jgi:hypothetical protein